MQFLFSLLLSETLPRNFSLEKKALPTNVLEKFDQKIGYDFFYTVSFSQLNPFRKRVYGKAPQRKLL
jgi:hypothetical protein